MLCPNCKQELPEGSKFCGYCGCAMPAEPAQEPAEQTWSEPVAEVQPESEFVAPVLNEEPVLVQPKAVNKKMIVTIAAAAAAVVVVVLAAVLLMNLFSGGGNAYVYLSDENYMLLKDVNGDPIKIASSKSDADDVYSYCVQFSPDGKYVYYFTKIDYYTGTLCRAEYAKLKEDSNKNNKYIEVIDSDVKIGSQKLTNKGVIYLSDDGDLNYFDGKTSNRIDKDVAYFYLNEAQDRILFTTEDEEENYDLHTVKLNDLNEITTLATNVDDVYNMEKFENIVVYSYEYEEVWNEEEGYYESNEESELLAVSLDKDPVAIAEDADVIYVAEDGSVYYVVESDTKLKLTDYVADDLAAADANAAEPDLRDYAVPRYDYRKVSDSSKTEADFSELYTSCTEDLAWLDGGWYDYSMEEALDLTFDTNSEAVVAALQSFINKYQSQQDENGMILVTEEVKTALKAITGAYYGADSGQWITLCYEKYQAGSEYNYDAYYEAQDAFYYANSRNELREELNGRDYALRNLYRIKDGKSELVCENIVDYDTITGGILYNTADMLTEKVSIEELWDVYEVYDLFYLDEYACNHLYAVETGKDYVLSQTAADTYGDAYSEDWAYMSLYGSDLFMTDGEDTLYTAQISGSEIADFEILADEGNIVGTDDDNGVYYMCDIYDNDGWEYGDLYYYSKGKSELKARDIMARYVWLYDDGSYMAYTDDSMELTLFDKKGEKLYTFDEVSYFTRVDSDTFFYISDDDLYCQDGDERERVGRDATAMWVKDQMEFQILYAGY